MSSNQYPSSIKYPATKEVYGRRRDPSFCDWIIIIGTSILAPLIIGLFLFWLLLCPHDAGGQTLNHLTPSADKPHKYVEVLITYYGKESCTNKECRTASGEVAHVGGVACERSIKLGTTIIIGGERYVCNDRYALWLDKKRLYPTVDIYTDASESVSLAFGLHKETVAIIPN